MSAKGSKIPIKTGVLILVYMSGGDARAIDSVAVRGELAGLGSHLPLCGFSDLNSDR